MLYSFHGLLGQEDSDLHTAPEGYEWVGVLQEVIVDTTVAVARLLLLEGVDRQTLVGCLVGGRPCAHSDLTW